MPIVPEGRFIPVNMDRCQDLVGGLFEHITPEPMIQSIIYCPVHLGTFNVWQKCLSLLGDGLVISTCASCCHIVLLLWGSGQLGLRSKFHIVYTYLGKVACDACRGLNLPLECCRTSQQ